MPESIRWRDGELWFVDGSRVRALALDGGLRTVAQTDAPLLLGMAFTDGGDVLVNDAIGRRVLSIAPGGKVTVRADLSGATDCMINEVAILNDGGLIIGDIGFDALGGEERKAARLIYVAADGHVSRTGSPLYFANGMVVCAGGAELIVAETYDAGLWRFRTIDGVGVNEGARTSLAAGALPDGIARSADGAIWYADIGTGAVACISDGGAEIESRPSGYPHATSCALSPDGRLFATVLEAMPSLPFVGNGAVVEIARDR